MLVSRGFSPGIRSGHKEKKEAIQLRAAHQTARVVAIHPSPLTRGLPPPPSGSYSPAGTESHKTSMSLKKLLACFTSDMLQLFDFDLRPYRSNESV
jgi:hypothetical protein